MRRRQFLNRLLKVSQHYEQTSQAQYLPLCQQKNNIQLKKIKLLQAGQSKMSTQSSQSSIPAKSADSYSRKLLQLNRGLTEGLPHYSCARTKTIEQTDINKQKSINPQYYQSQDNKVVEGRRYQFILESKKNHQQVVIFKGNQFNSNYKQHQYPGLRNNNFGQSVPVIKQSQISQYNNYNIFNSKKYFNSQGNSINDSPRVTTKNLQGKAINSEDQFIQIQSKFNSCRNNEAKYYKSSNHINYYNQQKLLDEQKKAKILMRKEINKNYGKPFSPPPKVTAKSYIIYEVDNNVGSSKVIVSLNCKNSHEVASLTKIMTCILIIQICQKCDINMPNEQVNIGKLESNIRGTSAQLKQGQIYTIQQLLYGLMLPSGNDASLALAVWCGRKILTHQRQLENSLKYSVFLQKQQKDNSPQLNKLFSSSCLSTTPSVSDKITKNQCYIRFIQQMNQKASVLKMMKTHYANSHGLSNMNNKSSAYDIALLSEYAMKNYIFRSIVSCKQFETTIRYTEIEEIKLPLQQIIKQEQSTNENINNTNEKELEHVQKENSSGDIINSEEQIIRIIVIKQAQLKWSNTHKLLHSRPHEYIGIKTGMTATAGSCLSSYIQIKDRKFIIIVLGCAKVSLRFKETQTLRKWLYKHEGIIKASPKEVGKVLTDTEIDKSSEDEEFEDEDNVSLEAED